MNRLLVMLAMACAVVAPACAQNPVRPAAQAAADRTAASDYQPEQLRGFARDTLTIQRSSGRDIFYIWLAETPEQQQQGLMWVQKLPADHGMLFLLDEPRPMSMWMKNTYVPLDMVFFDAQGRILRIHEHAVPLSEAIIDSGVNVAGVLEILAGEAHRRGLQVGDRLLLQRLAR
ncbi:MAG: DUF192 domain-containing protein [Steroidobacteraceae bacterium]